MITRTIEIEEKAFDIVVEVRRDGQIVEAKMIVAYMEDTPLDCTEAVKNSKHYSEVVAREFSIIDWKDHGDEGLDQYRSQRKELQRKLRRA